MKSNGIERITGKKRPLIGVIGAAKPTGEYSREVGRLAGYKLRKYLEGNEGTIFTGGVNGVGFDVYAGIVRFHLETYLKDDRLLEDMFFVLTPESEAVPKEYIDLSRIVARLEIVRVGADLEQRRTCLAEVADVLIVLNGAYGTLDEAVKGLKNSKRVVTLPSTGGTADLLAAIKEGSLDRVKIEELKELDLYPEGCDLDLITISSDPDDMIRKLSGLDLV